MDEIQTNVNNDSIDELIEDGEVENIEEVENASEND